MTRRFHLMPNDPRLFSAHVVRSRRLSPSFQRVTLAGGDLDDFVYAGFDHWFRLFTPQTVGAPFELPDVVGRSWSRSYLALDEAVRPHCANYTVAEVRSTDDGVELDIDVVLHRDDSGRLSAPVAAWSVAAPPDSPVAILDQGLLFDPVLASGPIVIACDETGVPAVRGILRGLDRQAQGVAIIEVPTAADRVELAGPEGVRIEWVVRDEGHDGQDGHGVPGAAALAAVRSLDALSAGGLSAGGLGTDGCAYVVGESDLAAEGRRALHRAGVPKARIVFSGYWKHSPELALAE
jgi:NADPH-dependent ferric siderophore reductase